MEAQAVTPLTPIEQLERCSKNQWRDLFLVFWQQHGYASEPPKGTSEAYWLLLENKSNPEYSTHPRQCIMDAFDEHLRDAVELYRLGKGREVKCPPASVYAETVNRMAREYEAAWTRQNPGGQAVPAEHRILAKAILQGPTIFLRAKTSAPGTTEAKLRIYNDEIMHIWKGEGSVASREQRIIDYVSQVATRQGVTLRKWPPRLNMEEIEL